MRSVEVFSLDLFNYPRWGPVRGGVFTHPAALPSLLTLSFRLPGVPHSVTSASRSPVRCFASRISSKARLTSTIESVRYVYLLSSFGEMPYI